MAVGCGAKCAKYLLFFFNFLFWLSGAAILGVGIWFKVDPSIINKFQIYESGQNDPYLSIAGWVLIGVGAFVFVVGFFGCCGAIKESKCLLGLYIFCMVLVMAAELGAGVVVWVFRDDIEAAIQKDLKKQVETEFGRGNAFDAAWNYTQMELQCCGAEKISDYYDSHYVNVTGSGKFPVSCCTLKDGATPEKPDFKDVKQCMTDGQVPATSSTVVNKDGCYDKMVDWLAEKSTILIGVACGVAGLEIFGFIFAICLCCNIDPEEKYR